MITSPSNPEIRALAALHKRSGRTETGTFLIEGRREIERALSAGFEVLKIVRREDTEPLGLMFEDVVIGAAAFAKIAYGRDGYLAVARAPAFALDSWSPPDLVLAAVAIEKPGNLGAMLRTCDALGAGMLLVDPVTDVTNPNTIRASTGALFTVPIAVASTAESISWLHQRRLRVVATAVGGGVWPWAVDLRGRVAIVIGSEDRGLAPPWLAAADHLVTLVQQGEVDSLNASVTAAVLLYEAVRQRSS